MTTTPFVAELAGLGTALAWSLSAMAWTYASRQSGAMPVAAVRLFLAGLVLPVLFALQSGSFWPCGFSARSQWLLIASGIMGAGLGDMIFFQALKLIGARLGMLVLTLSPALAALLALYAPLNERLNAAGLAGMALTIVGVGWAVLSEKGPRASELDRRVLWSGALRAGVASALFAGSFVLSRLAMHGEPGQPTSPLGASVIRVVAAAVFSLACLPVCGAWRPTLRLVGDSRLMRTMVWGTAVGPVLGIWLSMVSLAGVEAGIATALISAGPALFMLPLDYLAGRERPSFHGILGTFVACAGVAVLLLRDRF